MVRAQSGSLHVVFIQELILYLLVKLLQSHKTKP